ncbi:MAG: glutaredoxin [Actinomycetota bacterium]|nr:glutaredoxin [Actinomycetota bacterium]
MEVVLLTQVHCAFCGDAKQLLDRLASEYGLEVREVDLSSPEGTELARAHGILFPPGILVDGEAVSSGRPSERRLRRELERDDR